MNKKLEESFQLLTENRKILIVDGNKTSRSAIAKAFIQLKVPMHNLITLSHFDTAWQEIEAQKPVMVVSEYMLAKRCGLELAARLREVEPDPMQCAFIVMTKSVKESAVAEAAEENVDRFIVKPFSTDEFKVFISQVARMKVSPSVYQIHLMDGQKALHEDQLYEAEKQFKMARNAHDKPCLALYYLGQTYAKLGDQEKSEKSYRQGLEHNKIHYKCLAGLFDLYTSMKKLDEAYEMIKEIALYFPLSPQRLANAVELAVRTESFDDLDIYYELFVDLDERGEAIHQVISASMVIAGSFFFMKNVFYKAKTSLSRAIISSKHDPAIVKKVVVKCLEYECQQDAVDFLAQFDARDHGTDEYQIAKYLVLDTTEPTTETFEMGRRLIVDGIHDIEVYVLQIRRAREVGLKEWIERLQDEGRNRWPDQTERF